MPPSPRGAWRPRAQDAGVAGDELGVDDDELRVVGPSFGDLVGGGVAGVREEGQRAP